MPDGLRLLRSAAVVALLAGGLLFGTGCSWWSTNRCYVELANYEELREIFYSTNSLQRVEQEMEDRQMLGCERRQVRYWLSQDLKLEKPVSELAISGSTAPR